MNKNYIIIGLIVTIIALMCYTQCERSKYNTAQHNYETARDSMEVIQTKYNGIVYENNSLILSKKELQSQLDISKKEYNELEKKLNSTIAYYSNLTGKIVYDTIRMSDTMWVEKNVQYVRFSYNDKWATIDGTTKIENSVPQTSINILSISTPLHVGLTSDYKIFVKSDNPYVTFTDIEGAVVDGSKLNIKQRRFSLGLNVGFGAQYNILKHNIGLGPQVGLGINYRIL